MGVINGDTRSLDCRSNMSTLDANGLSGQGHFLSGQKHFLIGQGHGRYPRWLGYSVLRFKLNTRVQGLEFRAQGAKRV